MAGNKGSTHPTRGEIGGQEGRIRLGLGFAESGDWRSACWDGQVQIAQIVCDEIQASESKSLAGGGDVDGRTKVEARSKVAVAGEGSHCNLLRLIHAHSPYLARQLSVFCKPAIPIERV